VKTYRYAYVEDARCRVDVPALFDRRLGSFDRFLDYVRPLAAERLPDYTQALTETLNRQARLENLPEPYMARLKGMRNWSQEENLLRSAARFYLGELNCLDRLTEGRPVEVLSADAIRAYLKLAHLKVSGLEILMPKKNALAAWMDFLDRDIHNLSIKAVSSIEGMFWAGNQPAGLFKDSFDCSEFDLEDGRVGVKIRKCRWKNILAEFSDPEYAYAIACHYDFAAAKAANLNFILTRTQTLTQNASYCDFVWHDLRRDKDCRHPDSRFWDAL